MELIIATALTIGIQFCRRTANSYVVKSADGIVLGQVRYDGTTWLAYVPVEFGSRTCTTFGNSCNCYGRDKEHAAEALLDLDPSEWVDGKPNRFPHQRPQKAPSFAESRKLRRLHAEAEKQNYPDLVDPFTL